MLTEALDALQSLSEASHFHSGAASRVLLEVVKRAGEFLRQVVVGEVIHPTHSQATRNAGTMGTGSHACMQNS